LEKRESHSINRKGKNARAIRDGLPTTGKNRSSRQKFGRGRERGKKRQIRVWASAVRGEISKTKEEEKEGEVNVYTSRMRVRSESAVLGIVPTFIHAVGWGGKKKGD